MGLFSQNNRGEKVRRFYWIARSNLVRFSQSNKAGKEKSTKVHFEGKQSGNPILLVEKILRSLVAKPIISVLGYMRAYKEIFGVLVVKRKKVSLDI